MLQNWKTKLVYIGFGSFFGCICTIIGMLASPVTAQRDKFYHIECTGLTVVDKNGEPRIILTTSLLEGDANNTVKIFGHEVGGTITVYGEDRKSTVELRTMSVLPGLKQHGGVVTVTARGKEGKSSTSLYIDVHGGNFTAWGKDGKSQASLGVNEHGGRAKVYGKGDGTAIMGINQYGNGAVSTWDKNGYRQ